MDGYEFLEDLTSDILFKAYGATLEELFENAAKAMFSIICEPVPPKQKIVVKLEGKTLERLLYDWLSMLLAESEIRRLFFSKFKVKIKNMRLVASVYGSRAVPEEGRTQVKAVTMYKFGIKKGPSGYEATVSCDI